MMTTWVAPGRGATLAAVKLLCYGLDCPAPGDWKRRTSLLVDLASIQRGHMPHRLDRDRLHEVLRRLKDGEEL